MVLSFTNEEYADMIICYGYCRGNARAARNEYIQRYPSRRIPTSSVFQQTLRRLRETGSVRNTRLGDRGRPAKDNSEDDDDDLPIAFTCRRSVHKRKVKSAMTRTYNKTATALPYAPASIKKGRARDDEGEEMDDEPDEEEESDLENDALIKIKKAKEEKPGKEKPSSSKDKPSKEKSKASSKEKKKK